MSERAVATVVPDASVAAKASSRSSFRVNTELPIIDGGKRPPSSLNQLITARLNLASSVFRSRAAACAPARTP